MRKTADRQAGRKRNRRQLNRNTGGESEIRLVKVKSIPRGQRMFRNCLEVEKGPHPKLKHVNCTKGMSHEAT